MAHIVIVGCGYTGSRVARTLVDQGHDVVATSRDTRKLDGLKVSPLRFDLASRGDIDNLRASVDDQSRVLVSTPVADDRLAAALHAGRRVVFLSTTGVYGAQREVNEDSMPAPRTDRELARLRSEECLLEANSLMILRPAAIYGPYRGIHASLRSGEYQLGGEGGNYVSRVHVEDLSAHVVAALLSEATGAWPVADEEPCTSREIAEFCARLLNLPMPRSATPEELGETRRTDRRVDGTAIRRLLGVALKYPSYRAGITACVATEADARAL